MQKGKRDEERGINRSPRGSTGGAERAFSGSRLSCGAAGDPHLLRGRPAAPWAGAREGQKGEGSSSQRRRGWRGEPRRSEEALKPHGLTSPEGGGERPDCPAGRARSHRRRGHPGPAAPHTHLGSGPSGAGPPPPATERRPGGGEAFPGERAVRWVRLPPPGQARPGRAGPWGLSAAASPSPCRPGVGTWTGSCSTVILLSPASASSSSPSPERGGPGPASVRVPATARRGPAPAHLNSQRPLPGQAAGREGTRPASRRARPKLVAEIPEPSAGNTRSLRRKEPNADGKQAGKAPLVRQAEEPRLTEPPERGRR